jgi:hypothetical protein
MPLIEVNQEIDVAMVSTLPLIPVGFHPASIGNKRSELIKTKRLTGDGSLLNHIIKTFRLPDPIQPLLDLKVTRTAIIKYLRHLAAGITEPNVNWLWPLLDDLFFTKRNVKHAQQSGYHIRSRSPTPSLEKSAAASSMSRRSCSRISCSVSAIDLLRPDSKQLPQFVGIQFTRLP